MSKRFQVVVVFSMIFCLLLVWTAPAAHTVKTLYLDGTLVGSDSNSTAGLKSFSQHIILGAAGDATYVYNEYVGSMDEFAIYAGVLDPSRIQAHYDAKDSNSTYYAAVNQDNPLLWLRFEETDANDGFTAVNSGSATVGSSLYVQNGELVSHMVKAPGINAGSSALNFPDSGGDPGAFNGDGTCVDVNDPDEYLGDQLNGNVTVEVWLNFVDLNSPDEIDNAWPRFYQRKGSYGLYSYNDPNTLGIFGGDVVTDINLPYDINDGQWHQLVVTFESDYTPNPLPVTDTYIAEVAADNPLVWLRFEDDIPADSSGNDNWVSYGAAFSLNQKTGAIGNNAHLDKIDGSGIYGIATAKGPNAPPQDVNNEIGWQVYGDEYSFAPDDITFEMWYRCPRDQYDFAIFFQQLGAWTNEPRAPGVSNESGNLRVFCGAGAWEPGVSSYFDGKWHHLVVTYDEEYDGPETMNVQLYLDGFLKGEELFTGPNAKLGPELSHLLVGAENDIGYTYNVLFRNVDEFAIYEGILSPTRVLYHYAAWQPKDCAELVDRGGLPAWTAIDRNSNCMVDLPDFAAFALDWALCNEPGGGTGCKGNWY